MRFWVIRASQYATKKADGGEPPYEGCIPFLAEGFEHVPMWLADELPGEQINYLLDWDIAPELNSCTGYPCFVPEDGDFTKKPSPPEGGWPDNRVVIADDRMDDF